MNLIYTQNFPVRLETFGITLVILRCLRLTPNVIINVINRTCQSVRCWEVHLLCQLSDQLHGTVQQQQPLQLPASSHCHQVATDNNNIRDHNECIMWQNCSAFHTNHSRHLFNWADYLYSLTVGWSPQCLQSILWRFLGIGFSSVLCLFQTSTMIKHCILL